MENSRILLKVGVACACACLVGCGPPADGPSLVSRRDSAGVEIVEAFRPLWGDSSRWRVDPEPIVDLSLGTGEKHHFDQVVGMSRLSSGLLVVADMGWNEIRLYSPEGGFVASAGREGEGPGEFSGDIKQMLRAAHDTLWALDWDNRVSIFGPELDLARTFSLQTMQTKAQAIYNLGVGFMAAELFVPSWAGDEVGPIRTPTVLWRFDAEGVRLDSIGTTAGGEEYAAMTSRGNFASLGPLFPKEAQVAAHAGKIFVGNADAMEVEERGPTGDLVRILRIPDYPLTLSAAELAAERDALLSKRSSSLWRQVAENTPASGTRPAYDEMIVDPWGALWLRQYRGLGEAAEPRRWLVLGLDGTWLGTLETPDRFELREIHTDVLLGVWRDELNVSHPQVLRLDRG